VFGITRGTTREDFIKATLQSLAYQTRDVVETMYKDTGITIPALRVDGGAAKNDYLMQFQADILDTPIERAANLETTAMGAAYLAGLAVGFWQNTDELQQIATIGKRFTPQMAADRRADLYAGWQAAVQATMAFKRN
jgi:glycerol kinase